MADKRSESERRRDRMIIRVGLVVNAVLIVIAAWLYRYILYVNGWG
jgi:hypothetical protein